MMHRNRTWTEPLELGTAQELAHELTRMTWTPCAAFRLGSLLLLNDSTSPDGAQEYAVVEEPAGIQVDSLTVSWMTEADLVGHVMRLQLQRRDHAFRLDRLEPRFHLPGDHCSACA